MKTFLCVCAIFFVVSVPASAQAPDSRWNAYAFLAPGSSTNVASGRATIHVGGGAERFIYQGLSLGAEAGPIIPWTAPGRGFNPSFNDRVHGLASADIAYHFLSNTTDRKLDPFLIGGYSLFFES